MDDLGSRLRLRLEADEILLLPGAPSAIFARVLEDAGFEAVYATGAGIANSAFAFPDVGLVTMSETVLEASRIIGSVSVPVIIDADTGYGGPLNVMRTVQQLEQIGAAGIQLEDQQMPKRCGHFDGKVVVDADEMCIRIAAAVRARKRDTVIIARTDALAVHGIDDAIARANRYLASGADVAFVEAPTTIDQLARIPREIRGPVLVNIVEGGRTPVQSASELEAFGFRIALFANTALRLATSAVDEGMRVLRDTGSTEHLLGRLTSWEDRQRLVRLSEYQALEDEFARKA